MFSLVKRYTRWLHTRWPAGGVEKLPDVAEDGSTNVPGVHVVGDLTGVPLLKLAADSGARVIRKIVDDPGFERGAGDDDVLDVAIVGGGVSGMAAALEARAQGLRFEVFEAAAPFSTIANFPKAKPIYTYPSGLVPAGDLQFSADADVKESLLAELRAQTVERGIETTPARVERVRRSGGRLEVVLADGDPVPARHVVLAIGRSGNHRTLGVPGEDRDKVSNRLHDPADFRGRRALVVGGGDSALEAAIALARGGAHVTLSYRKEEFSRPKPENVESLEALRRDPSADVSVERPSSDRVTASAGPSLDAPDRPVGSLDLRMGTEVKEIGKDDVTLVDRSGAEETRPNDAVFAMIGREPPLDFFRRSGVRVRGEWSVASKLGLVAFFAFCVFLYHWKTDLGFGLKSAFAARGLFPFNLAPADDPSTLLGTIRVSMHNPSFWYTLAYTVCIVLFGIRRIRRRRTPYVTLQTVTLAAIQVVPLFLLPFVVLPWLGHNGAFEAGAGRSVADALFPVTEWDAHGREYWRSVGFILAWPLLPWNLFTDQPITAWIVIGLLQTFVLIPLLVRKWGKGAYCGWICSCGALAETMGDAHRHKMPHGPRWNRANMIGQAFLLLAFVLLVLRVAGWLAPEGRFKEVVDSAYMLGFLGKDRNWGDLAFPLNFLNYAWFVDLLWAGIFGVAFYFWFSGRVWCRFACPLAALMHVYARFSRFRIVAEKKKCISCNVCTSVCHQGIDVMNFANKGRPMEDPQCVRCSACVQSCPTGVLRFGEVDRRTGDVVRLDRLAASPVRMEEERG
ncbi:MAG: NAD(P)-binding domain-containing protein [Planctomycetota bacterium JB042]